MSPAKQVRINLITEMKEGEPDEDPSDEKSKWKKKIGKRKGDESKNEKKKKEKEKKVEEEEQELEGENGGYVLSEEEMKNRGVDLTPEEKRIHQKYKKDPSWADHFIFSPKLRIVYVVLLCVILGLLIPFFLIYFEAFESAYEDNYQIVGECLLNTSYMFPCKDTEDMNSIECVNVGCCYDSSLFATDPYIPRCYHRFPSVYEYEVTESPSLTKDTKPLEYQLLSNQTLSMFLSSTNKTTLYRTNAWNITARIWRVNHNVVRVLLHSPENDEQLPFSVQPPVTTGGQSASSNYSLDVTVESDIGGIFYITVFRTMENGSNSDGTANEGKVTIFETTFGPLQYGENYVEITAKVPSQYIYGLGPKNSPYLVPNFDFHEKWSLKSGEDEGAQGAFPFYFLREPSGRFHGVLLQNAAPMELGVLPSPSILFRSLKGAIDLQFLAGPTPKDVSQQLRSILGFYPSLPPYWALGYHLCRSVDEKDPLSTYQLVRNDMEGESIPYESDCINGRLTYPDSFGTLPRDVVSEIESIKAKGRKFLLVGHPFLEADGNMYQAALSADVLVKLNETHPYFGLVDSKSVVYPDFLNNQTFLEWLPSESKVVDRYLMADGLILLRNSPLNEASVNFTINTEITLQNCTSQNPELCCVQDGLTFRPLNSPSDISENTICGAALHLSGNTSHTSVHNIYGAYHSLAMQTLIEQIKAKNQKSSSSKTRQFVTSSSLFPGFNSGYMPEGYGPNFVSQQKALANVLLMGLQGFPLSGTPLCGSRNEDDADEHKETINSEWCLRAHQNAVLLPLSFSYYEEGQSHRNPSVSTPQNFTLELVHNLREFIRLRYMFLPYLYTLFFESSISGSPVSRPLFYEFPEDEGSLEVSSQFMAGPGLLVSPTMSSQQDSTSASINVHFPPACWYDFYSGILITNKSSDETLSVPSTQLTLHVRGGYVVPLQGSMIDDELLTTEDWRTANFTFIVALSCLNSTNATANGYVYLDDGETVAEDIDEKSIVEIKGSSSGVDIVDTGSFCNYVIATNFSTVVDRIRVFGVPAVDSNSIRVNGESRGSLTQDEDSLALDIEEISADWCEGDIEIRWDTV